MPDLSPIELKPGYTLVYQRSRKSYTVRAVIKDANGDIIVRGTVVPEAQAIVSSRSCTMSPEWMKILAPELEPIGLGGLATTNARYDDIELDEEDEDDEDAEATSEYYDEDDEEEE